MRDGGARGRHVRVGVVRSIVIVFHTLRAIVSVLRVKMRGVCR